MNLDFSGKKALVIGDVMLDQYAYHISRGQSPEAPVPDLLEEDDHIESKLGGAANVAANLQALGIETALAGVIGHDLTAEIFKDLLGDINFIPFVDENRPTTRKKRILASSKAHPPYQIVRLSRESTEPISPELQSEVISKLSEEMKSAHILVFADYNKGFLTERIIKELKHLLPIPKVVDTKPQKIGLYKGWKFGGDLWLKPNIKEVEEITGIPYNGLEDKYTLRATGEFLFNRFYPSNVLLTLGSDGMILYTSPTEFHYLPARQIENADVSGAGDTVNAALAAAIANNYTPLESATIANYAASVVVEKRGTATCSLEELTEAMKDE
ncbi:MAG: bifunctional hydroxymethylpyrimidine kinase/phosphomethylpyrimidine kinase [Nanoarchaeota archaeon]|nr:bifunctional hydroxymethylpyrimidine kinase/phosphomethylpyrimidine kinase [Nanoarchaeota archaeon]